MIPFPDVVRIEPAGRCNFRCTHCPIGQEGGHRSLLSFGAFITFLEMLPLVPRVLVLYHGGEPLLNKDLERMIEHAKSIGVHKVVLNTNASMLGTPRDWSRLDEMRVSFDGSSPEENNTIRVGSDFERHAAFVRELARSTRKPRQITIYNAGTGRVADYLLDFFAGVDVLFRAVKFKEWARLANDPSPSNGTTYCTSLFETFTILSNGDVPMCCEDLQADDVRGNVFQNSPAELWEQMQTRRDAFQRGEYPRLCQTCWVTRKDRA